MPGVLDPVGGLKVGPRLLLEVPGPRCRAGSREGGGLVLRVAVEGTISINPHRIAV